MRSTFLGLETAKRGMYTQQGALYTTGHNISNANTPGYSRQRVNFEQTEPYPAPAMNRPNIPGQIGTGVKEGSIQRVRDSFLDIQYRGENNKLGYWESKMEAMKKMEEVMNEPSESGLSKTMDMFWQSLQDLAVNPTNAGARSVVRERGIAVANTFNYLSSSLTGVRDDLKNELSVSVKQINSLTNQIDKLNQQIADVEPHGYLPNDLYDERDRLIDELSKHVSIQTTYQSSGGASSPIAEGQVTINLVGQDGNVAVNLVGKGRVNELKVSMGGPQNTVDTVTIGTKNIDVNDFLQQGEGKLRALIDTYGYQDKNGEAKGSYITMLNELDSMAYEFAKAFNEQHQKGVSPAGMEDSTVETPKFFQDSKDASADLGSVDKSGFAHRIQIADELINLDMIATASAANPTLGDSKNVGALADIITSVELSYGEKPATFRAHFESVIGAMAVESQESVRLSQNSEVLRSAVDERRMSVSGVSLDEEMTNMIKYQHAYNASARMITLQDEMLDKIINGMGTVGR
ncbi:flagellar hook-associated protein FlgK [Rossellomorea aquimaris]|uniref:flagellar hook-associated protein FlgK n=1 Tax=Rossellomorea aquimaris TaxID=189382 RepID=UPI001CD80396|nr:flagellar hook-associated protein FlgK [Rossellomorea aquimaris]MCA1055294.1 flagellar hook-associated protein FlgK [Rossellomorea aquimaris]